MSVFGIDFGTLNSTVAITRQGGVDIVTNEVSKRETTTMVGFIDNERFIGEQALDRYVRNAKNTVFMLKRLIGMRMDDPQFHFEKHYVTCDVKGDEKNRLMLGVQYCGEKTFFYPEQVLAMVLKKLKGYVSEAATVDPSKPADVRDCVITVPSYYTAEQRYLIYQAAETAGVHCMSLVNESTAVAVDYGIFRGATLNETEEQGQIVGILDIGYSTTTFAIYKFWKGHGCALAQAFDRNCGTRDIDYKLYTAIGGDVKEKYKVDVLQNQRAGLRVLQACERLKYLLSANQVAPLNVENVMDIDINIPTFERSRLEALSVDIVERVKAVINRGLENAKLTIDHLHSLEMIGGGCRIPMFKNLVESMLGRAPNFTLNASESVVRGAAVLAAVFSPMFQVREFMVSEITNYPIQLGYFVSTTNSPVVVPFLPDVNKVVTLLAKNDFFPKTLDATVPCSGPMKLYAFYNHTDELVKKEVPKDCLVIGEWEVMPPSSKTNVTEMRVRLDLQQDGLISLKSAKAVAPADPEPAAESPESEEAKKEGSKPPAAEGEKDGEKKEGEKEKKKKPKHKTYDAIVKPRLGLLGHEATVLLRFQSHEKEMFHRDDQIIRTREKKNELESYILNYRPRLSPGGLLVEYATEENRNEFVKRCDEDEQWLYGDGDEATLEEYESRIKALRAVGDPAHTRLRIREEVEFEVQRFIKKMDTAKQSALDMIGKKAHITEEELRTAAETAEAAKTWATNELATLLALPKTQDGAFTTTMMNKKAEEVMINIRTVTNKPAPPPPKPAPVPGDAKTEAAPAAAGTKNDPVPPADSAEAVSPAAQAEEGSSAEAGNPTAELD